MKFLGLAFACAMLSGCAATSAADLAPRAGIEPDPVRHPEYDRYCTEPQRAYNRESYPVVVHYTEKWFQDGPGCNVAGSEKPESRELGPGDNVRLFCTRIATPGSMCIDNWRARNVRAVPK